MILAPLFRRREEESNEGENAKLDSNDSRALTGFRAVYVFDESMTAGNPLPQIGSINGDPGSHRERLDQFVREQGIALEYSGRHRAREGRLRRWENHAASGPVTG
jgi:hypothetical protein